MELTYENLQDLFQTFNARFLEAIKEAKVPDSIATFTETVPSTTGTEEYPVLALLGDLERFQDELQFMNIARWLQGVENELYNKGLGIPSTHIADDKIGFYARAVARLGRKAATYVERQVPRTFVNGLVTAWVDGANVWSNNHAWIGGQAWDNLDVQPLTVNGFEIVCTNLMNRVGPDGENLDLEPTHLVVGPALWFRAKRLIQRGLIGGGDTNIHYESVQVVKWSALSAAHAYDWFVADCRDEQPRIAVTQNRSGPSLIPQVDPNQEGMFLREEARYKVRRRGANAVLCPWLVQYVHGGDEQPTTTTAAR